jgi:hypothetical protein
MKEDRGPTPPLDREDGAYLAARRASLLVNDHMLNAAFDIDEQFGPGFARQNPALLAACVQAATLSFAACLLADKIDGLHESLRSDHPLQNRPLDDG